MLFIFAEQAVFRRKILALADERQDDVRGVLDTIGRGIQRYLGVKTIVSLADRSAVLPGPGDRSRSPTHPCTAC